MKILFRNVISIKYELEYLKSATTSGTVFRAVSSGNLRSKKKINSKLNTFIYKPKYDKLPKQLFTAQVPTTSKLYILFI
jgi:hypothetical protein